MSEQYLLEMKGICKSFPGVKALQNVDLQLKAGEVHALLGENGAGKSTLIKVLGGIYHAEEGEIIIDGQKVNIDGVVAARHAGISIVHQELVLVPYMTVAENIFLGREPGTKMNVDRRKMVEEAQKLLDTYEMNIDANMLVERLTIAQQQMVEIVKAISFNSKILVLDEPTAGLGPKERVRFRNIISSLGKDRIVLLSTHIVSDIEYIADRILIMKNGELIQEGTEAELTEKVKGHVWKCIVSEKEAECLGQRFVVSNMRSNGENIELRVISEKQPMREAELLEGTLEDAYLYETQSAEET